MALDVPLAIGISRARLFNPHREHGVACRRRSLVEQQDQAKEALSGPLARCPGLCYLGGGETLQLTVVVLPDESVAVTDASPSSVIFQSITPGPGFVPGVAPGACASLIFVPSWYGPATKLLPVSCTRICGFGSTASFALSR